MAETKSIYIKRDGNGGISISIPLAIIMAIVTLLATVLPSAMAYGALNERVSNIEKNSGDGVSKNLQTIEGIESRLIILEKIAAGTQVSLQEIQKDIDEIKADLKDVKKDLKTNGVNGQ